MHLLLVAVGGALGAMTRYSVYNVAAFYGNKPAWATFFINAVGAFLIGVAYLLLLEKSGEQAQLRSLITVGFLGAFTTYSSYSLDALQLFEQGQVGVALFYLLGTMVVCVLATWMGLTVTRFFL